MAYGPTQDFIVNSGLNVQGVALATSSTGNTSTLQVDGGAGIAKNLIVGSDTTVYGNLTLIGSMPNLTVGGNTNLNNLRVTYSTSTNLDVSSRLIVGGLAQLNNATLSNLTQSTSSSTGALVVDGGVGIRKDLWVGGRMFVGGGEVLTTSSLVADTLQTVTQNGSGTSVAIILSNTTSSISTGSGALVVYGGVGIGGALYVNTTSYINSSQILTVETVDRFAVKTITAGTDTQVNSTSGNVIVWNTSTLQSVTDRGSTTTNAITITNATASADSATGALIVTGGVAVGKNLNVAGNITTWGNITANGNIVLGNSTGSDTITIAGEIQSDLIPKIAGAYNLGSQTNYWNTIWADEAVLLSNADTNSTNSGALQVVGGVGIGAGLVVGGVSTITNTTSATSTATGALQVYGGAGIGGALYAGPVYSDGSRVVTEASLGSLGVTSITAGTDTAISTSTGGVTIWNVSTLQSVTDRGALTTNAISITNTTDSTSTTTGALTVGGGLGLGGNLYSTGRLYVGDGTVSYSNLTTATSGLYAARSINLIDTNAVVKVSRISNTNAPAVELQAINTSGVVRSYWDVSVSTAAGGVDDNMGFRWRTTNLSSSAGADRLLMYGTGTALVVIPMTTATNSTATGALVVKGGVGIGGGMVIGGAVTATNTTSATSTITGAFQVVGGVGIGGNLYVGAAAQAPKVVVSGAYSSIDWSNTGTGLSVVASTYTNLTSSGVVANSSINAFGIPTIASVSATTISAAATVYIAGAPIAGSGTTITNAYSLRVAGGTASFAAAVQASNFTIQGTGGLATSNQSVVPIVNTYATTVNFAGSATTISIGSTTGTTTFNSITSSTSTNTGALVVNGGTGIAGNLYVGGTINGNLGGGSTGAIFYQISTGSTTSLPLGTNGYILSAGGAAPQWIPVSGLTAGSSNTATNLAQGGPGQIPYQSGAGTTVFIATGTAGTVLVSNGTSAPTFNNTLTLAGSTQATSTITGAFRVVGGVGIGGNLYVGGEIVAQRLTIEYTTVTTTLVTTDDVIITTNTSYAYSTTSGALQISGGAGIAGGIYVGGISTFTNTVVNAGIQATNIVASGTLGVTGTSTLGVVNATSGTFSGTLGVTGTSVLNGLQATNIVASGTLGVTGTSILAGVQASNIVASGTLGVTGTSTLGLVNATSATFSGTLGVTGTSTLGVLNATSGTFSGTLGVTGTSKLNIVNATSATFSGTLGVTGTSVLNGLQATNIVASGTLGVTGTAVLNVLNATSGTFSGTLGVTGTAVLSGGVQSTNIVASGTLGVTGTTTLGVVNATSGTFSGTLGVTGTAVLSGGLRTTDISASGTLGVTGTSILAGLTTVTNTTAATSTNTGALQVRGGVGIGGNTWIGGSALVSGGNIDLRNSTTASIVMASLAQQGNTTVFEFGRTDVANTPAIDFHSSGGNIDFDARIISNGGNTATVGQARLDLIANQVYLTSTQTATTTATGALRVEGGVGIGGDLYVGGPVTASANSATTTGTTVQGILYNNTLLSAYTSGALTTTTAVTLDAFSTSTYRSAKYFCQAVAGTSVHVSELSVFHSGGIAYLNEYGIAYNNSTLGTYDAVITGSNVAITFTPNTTTSIVVKLSRLTITL